MILYLDIHGVLCDLDAGIKKRLRRRYVEYPPGEYRLDRIYGCQVPIEEYSSDWWANLPPTLECGAILDMCYDMDATLILTTAPCSPQCAAGTLAWASVYKLPVVTLSDKGLLARPDTYLIDDADCQITSFGEHGILCPRPWNRGHSLHTLPYIEHALSRITNART